MYSTENYYDCLKVERTATAEQIVEAYRHRILETHPDRGGSTEEFLMVRKAYSILSDPQKRASYDKTLLGFSNNNSWRSENSHRPDSSSQNRYNTGTSSPHKQRDGFYQYPIWIVVLVTYAIMKMISAGLFTQPKSEEFKIPYNSTDTYSVYGTENKGIIKVTVYDLKTGNTKGYYYVRRKK